MAERKNMKYKVYVDRKDGKGFELAAWFDDAESAHKEARFLRSKGYDVVVR